MTRAERHRRATATLWWLVAYLVILYALFRLDHHIPVRSPGSTTAD